MNWDDAVRDAKNVLGFGYGWLEPEQWDEVVSVAKSILREYHYEEYLEFTNHLTLYYKVHIQSQTWKDTRKYCLKRDNYKCNDCGGVAVTVHHLKYDNMNKASESSDCISLCGECHSKRHEKDFTYKGSRFWFTKSGTGFHTVMFCPKCDCQRTWSSKIKNFFVCDHCSLKLEYMERHDRFKIISGSFYG